jgi:hypothetical protein
MSVEKLIEEMRTIAMVAGQCSVEGPQDDKALMAAAEAERCTRWADQLEAALRSSPSTQGEGVGLIAAERQRQMAVEGYSPEHDDTHDAAEMVGVAINYAALARFIAAYKRTDGERYFYGLPPKLEDWPIGCDVAGWWKPDYADPIRDLVKAGALIAAEIDRLRRASSPQGSTPKEQP